MVACWQIGILFASKRTHTRAHAIHSSIEDSTLSLPLSIIWMLKEKEKLNGGQFKLYALPCNAFGRIIQMELKRL